MSFTWQIMSSALIYKFLFVMSMVNKLLFAPVFT